MPLTRRTSAASRLFKKHDDDDDDDDDSSKSSNSDDDGGADAEGLASRRGSHMSKLFNTRASSAAFASGPAAAASPGAPPGGGGGESEESRFLKTRRVLSADADEVVLLAVRGVAGMESQSKRSARWFVSARVFHQGDKTSAFYEESRSVGARDLASKLGHDFELPVKRDAKAPGARVFLRAGKGCEIPNFKGSYLGRFPLVLADFWTSDHLSERSLT